MLRRTVLLVALAATALPGLAQDKGAQAPHVGIKGYDPVSYFSEGRAAKGASGINYDFDDTRYLFASQKHRATFSANPASYEPQFGGLCATGIALGMKAESDPEQWVIIGGKLYVFSSVEAKEMAVKDPALLQRAHHNAARAK